MCADILCKILSPETLQTLSLTVINDYAILSCFDESALLHTWDLITFKVPCESCFCDLVKVSYEAWPQWRLVRMTLCFIPDTPGRGAPHSLSAAPPLVTQGYCACFTDNHTFQSSALNGISTPAIIQNKKMFLVKSWDITLSGCPLPDFSMKFTDRFNCSLLTKCRIGCSVTKYSYFGHLTISLEMPSDLLNCLLP